MNTKFYKLIGDFSADFRKLTEININPNQIKYNKPYKDVNFGINGSLIYFDRGYPLYFKETPDELIEIFSK